MAVPSQRSALLGRGHRPWGRAGYDGADMQYALTRETSSMTSTLALLTALSLLATVGPALARSEGRFNDVPSIEVQGSAHEQVTPDLAQVTVLVEVQGKTPQELTRPLSERVNQILAVLRQMAVKDEQTQSNGPNIDVIYERVLNDQGREIIEKRRQTGVRASYQLTITTAALDMLPQMLPKLGESGGLVQGVDFQISDREQRQRVLEERAVRDGVERAKRLIQAAGVKPGRLLEITRDMSGPGQADLPSRRLTPGKETTVTAPLPVRPGRIDLQDEVTIVMEMLSP